MGLYECSITLFWNGSCERTQCSFWHQYREIEQADAEKDADDKSTNGHDGVFILLQQQEQDSRITVDLALFDVKMKDQSFHFELVQVSPDSRWQLGWSVKSTFRGSWICMWMRVEQKSCTAVRKSLTLLLTDERMQEFGERGGWSCWEKRWWSTMLGNYPQGL